MLYSFVSRFHKCHSFSCTTITNAKNCVSKSGVITLTCFSWPLHSQKMKILLWNLCILITYIPFFRFCKTFEFYRHYFWKIEILRFVGQNWKQNHKSEIAILQSVQFYAVPRFLIASYLKTKHSSSLQTFAVFLTRTGETWRHKNAIFWKYSRRIFSAILLAGVKLVLGRVLKVSRWYLPPFLSYRENPAEGRNCPQPPTLPPPQRGAC